MLKGLNSLIKSVILEQVDQNNEDDEKRIKNMYHTNEFYNRFLLDLSMDNNVVVSKQRNNTFLAIGTFKDIIKFFNDLKVDEDFMEKPSEFVICAPMYCFNDSDYEHQLARQEAYAPTTTPGGTPTTHDDDNEVRSTIYGRWYDFYENEKKGQKLLTIFPGKFKKYIKDVEKKYNFKDEDIIYIEFSVNCEQWKNNIFEEMTEYKTEDDINDFANKQNDDFDYSIAAVVKNTDDSHRKALKDIEKKEITYKENKIK